jgi:type IV pilus assembly protein PilW
MRQSRTPVRVTRGFTIVEVMVGLVLGMIGIIIMYQVFAAFEGQRRTTVSGGTAQTSGHIALYAIERQLRLAGLGTMYITRPELDQYKGEQACPLGIRTYSANTGGLGWTGSGNRPIVPVSVTDGGAAGSDSFTILYGPSAMGGAPAELKAAEINAGNLALGIQVTNAPFVDATAVPPINAVFKKDDIVLIAQPTTDMNRAKHCVRLKISKVESVEIPPLGAGKYQAKLYFEPGGSNDENPPPGEYAAFLPAPVVGDPGGYTLSPPTIVTHMGASLATSAYQVDAQNQLLQNGTPIADGVVSMQVQYGIGPRRGELGCLSDNLSEPACQVVKAWTSAVAFDGVNWGTLASDPWPADLGSRAARLENIARIKAVRVAVVMRSQNLERDPLYGAGREIQPKGACLAAGDLVDSGGLKLCAWRDPAGGVNVPLVDLTGTVDWDRYRYRVYDSVVPLRNVIWSSRGA